MNKELFTHSIIVLLYWYLWFK